MLKPLIFFALSLLGIIPISALAQDSTLKGPLKWDLQTCLDYARKNNTQINTLRLDQQINEQDLLQAKAARLPSLSGTATQIAVHSKNTNPVVGGFQTSASFSGNYSLNSNFIIYQGGLLGYNIKEAQMNIQAASLNVAESDNSLTLQITQAFLNILLTRENIVYLKEVDSTSQVQQQLGQQRFDAGAFARKDYVQLEAQSATDHYNLVNAQNTLRQNIVTLKQDLQIPSSVEFDVVVPDTLVTQQTVPALQDAEQAALQTRPEVKIADLDVHIQEVNLDIARSGFRPTLTAGGTLSTGYSNNATTKYFNQIDNNFFQRLGLTLGIPIFTNRINRTNVEKAKIQIQEAKLSLAGTKITLDQEVEQAYISLLNARAQYTAADLQLKANTESYHIVLEQIRIGAGSTLDLLTQKSLYVQAVQAYVQAKYNVILNQKIYDFYTGVPVTL
jgi:outer membrane protein